MKKKSPALQLPKTTANVEIDDRHWHNGGDIEIMMYARSLHKAAKTLIETLTAWMTAREEIDAVQRNYT